jgi:hypothetical protein
MTTSSARRAALALSPALLTLALGASGCTIEHVHDDDGLLTVQWSLDRTFDPEACFDYGSRSIELVIYDRYDDVVDHFEARCADFATTIELEDGVYGLDATLLDRSGRSVTTTLELEVDVYEGEETVVDIDFPFDSLL